MGTFYRALLPVSCVLSSFRLFRTQNEAERIVALCIYDP